jgi:hypothetical protein
MGVKLYFFRYLICLGSILDGLIGIFTFGIFAGKFSLMACSTYLRSLNPSQIKNERA